MSASGGGGRFGAAQAGDLVKRARDIREEAEREAKRLDGTFRRELGISPSDEVVQFNEAPASLFGLKNLDEFQQGAEVARDAMQEAGCGNPTAFDIYLLGVTATVERSAAKYLVVDMLTGTHVCSRIDHYGIRTALEEYVFLSARPAKVVRLTSSREVPRKWENPLDLKTVPKRVVQFGETEAILTPLELYVQSGDSFSKRANTVGRAILLDHWWRLERVALDAFYSGPLFAALEKERKLMEERPYNRQPRQPWWNQLGQRGAHVRARFDVALRRLNSRSDEGLPQWCYEAQPPNRPINYNSDLGYTRNLMRAGARKAQFSSIEVSYDGELIRGLDEVVFSQAVRDAMQVGAGVRTVSEVRDAQQANVDTIRQAMGIDVGPTADCPTCGGSGGDWWRADGRPTYRGELCRVCRGTGEVRR